MPPSNTFSPLPQQTNADQINNAMAADDDQAKLLCWHHRLSHLPFSMLKTLARNGKIPKRFEKVKKPICAGCLYGKMSQVPWCTQSKADSKVHKVTNPGECLSVNQIESIQDGVVDQHQGCLTTMQYKLLQCLLTTTLASNMYTSCHPSL